MSLNVAIVGPSRNRQGTGPYVAKVFHQLGANLCAVVSRTSKSAGLAAKRLKTDHGVDCAAFANMEEMLDSTPVDIVAICSPAAVHGQHLNPAIEAGCHIFCEKPLLWPREGVDSSVEAQRLMAETARLVRLCDRKNIHLQLNTQWVFTIPGFYALYPPPPDQTIETFSMWLSPQSTGKDMIVDAVPHLLSMLYALLGAGRVYDIRHRRPADAPGLQIEFDYLHASGDSKAALFLNPVDTVPRPAAYAINNLRVDRHVDLPDYLISLLAHGEQLPIVDPLVCSIKNFIGSIHSGSALDEPALIDGMEHLLQIFQAIDP